MAEQKLTWTARQNLAADGPIVAPVLLGSVPTAGTSKTSAARGAWRYPLLTACLLLYFYPFLRVLTLPVDEGWCLTDAARVYHGQLPFRDFFEIVGPGTFYWIALFFNLFGENWLATRVCVLVGGLATALLVYFLARRLKPGSETGALLFWLAVSFPTWPAVNHHLVANLFALAAFGLAVRWLDTDRPGLLFLCGMATGVTASVMLQKGVLLFFALVLTMWFQRARPGRPASIAWMLSGVLSVALTITAYFWARGGLSDLIYANFVWPVMNYSEVGHTSYGFGLAKNSMISFYSAAELAIGSALWIPLVVVVLLPAAAALLGVYFRSAAFNARTLPYWLAGSALWISEAHRPDMIHLVLGSPLLIVLCFSYLHEIRAVRRILVFSSAIRLSAAFLLCLTAKFPISTPMGSVNAFEKSPVIDFTNSHVKPGETIFVYPYAPIYYFLSGTSNPTRFSYLLYRHHTRDQMLEIMESLEKDKTRYVIWDTTFETSMAPAYLPAYRPPSDNDRIIEPYLNEHYKQIGLENGFRFMERKEGP